MRKRIKDCLKSIRYSRSGVTLVELIVTFAITGIFLAGVSGILARALHTYHDMRSMNEAVEVSDTILTKICGMIEGADNKRQSNADTGQNPDGVINQNTGSAASQSEERKVLKINPEKIYLKDRTGSEIYITSSADTGVRIHYYAVRKYAAVDWLYDKDVYMDYRVRSLKFVQEQNTADNVVIKVTLELEGNGNVYSFDRYVYCYNFETEEDLKLIDWNWDGNTEDTDADTQTT